MSDAISGNRKMVLGLVLVLIGTAVDLATKGGLSANLLDLLKWMGAGFFAGNVGEHFAHAIKGRQTASVAQEETPPPLIQAPDLSPIVQGLEDVKAQNLATQQGVATTQQTLSFIITKAKLDQMP